MPAKLPNTGRYVLRFQMEGSVAVLSVHYKDLETRLARRQKASASGELLDLDAWSVPGDRLDGVQHLLPAAKILGQFVHFTAAAPGLLPIGAEHLRIGMPKPVNRLIDIPHDKQLGALPKTADQPRLQRVLILKFIDENVVEGGRNPPARALQEPDGIFL